jgi:phenylacetate-CoA ligase
MTNYWRLINVLYQLYAYQYEQSTAIEALQLNKFKRLLCHAYNKIPMYRDFYDAQGFHPNSVKTHADIQNVPVITRDCIQSYPAEKRADSSVPLRRIYREKTSGSTGQPLEKWNDRTECLIQILKVLRFFREWGYSPFDRTVRLWGGAEEKKSIIQKFGLFRRKDIEIVGHEFAAIEEALRSKCDVLYGSRSSLEALVDQMEARNTCLNAKILVSTGQMLMGEHRKRFQDAFDCYTTNSYSSEEMGSIAWECPENNGHLHIEAETVLVQVSNCEITSNGKIGSCVLTNLESYVMPFIRYEQGDRVRIPDDNRCICGRNLPLLGEVFGRDDDFIMHGGKKYYWNFFYNIFEKGNFQYVKQYQIVQHKDGSLEFKVLLFDNSDSSKKRCQSDLNSAFMKYFPRIDIRFAEAFQLPPNRKVKVLQRET